MNNNEIQSINPISNDNINNIEAITPVNNIQNSTSQVQPLNTNQQTVNDEFATGLPDWDLVPPYTTVRRVNRK